MNSRSPFVWRELTMSRPLDEQTVLEGMRRVIDDVSAPRVAFELRGSGRSVRLLLGAQPHVLARVSIAFGSQLSAERAERVAVTTCRSVQPQPSETEFASDPLGHVSKAVYEAVSRAGGDEVAAVQVVLGRRLPATTPAGLWAVETLLGVPSGGEQSPSRHPKRVEAVVRIGTVAATPERRKALMLTVMTALRRSETSGMHLRLRTASSAAFDEARLPWRGVSLSAREAAALAGFPVGDELAGLPSLHPRILAPRQKLIEPGRGQLIVAETTAPNVNGVLTLDQDAVLRGVHLLGPMGSGKSDAAAQLALQWIQDGKACVVFEPKRDLCNAIAARVAPKQQERVVYVDLQADDTVIGFNPLKLNGRPPELVVDELVSIFVTVLSDVIGVTTRDLLNASLLTLVQYPDATLLMLPLLLSDPHFRRKVVANVAADDVFLQAYWAEFEASSEQARSTLVAPVLRRLRQVLLRKTFRDCLGQAHPKFDVRDVFEQEKKILLVPLPEAQLGKEGVALFGSLMLHAVFGAVRERATAAPEKRHPVMIVVDEWHRFVHRSEGFAEALTLFRGYGAGFVLCNQVLKGQLSPELRDIVLGAVRSHVYFQLGPDDAATVARHDPELTPLDFMKLGQFHIYAALHDHGSTGAFVSGKTIKLPDVTADVDAIRRTSSQRYGQPRSVVAEAIADIYGTASVPRKPPPGHPRVGRRPTTRTKGDES